MWCFVIFKVFPATITADNKKIPLIRDWQNQASNDPNQIKQWMEFFRDRLKLWGAPTGEINNIFTLDIDTKPGGVNGFETLKARGIELPNTAWQSTPSGGMHLIFKYDPSLGLRNTANKELGLDTRASGGWIGLYDIKNIENIQPIPQWVHDVILKPIKPIDPNQVNTYEIDPSIAMEKFNQCIEAIRNAGQGERNQTLNVNAYLIGQLVNSKALSYEYAYDQLTKAAQSIGLDPYEIQATILSGLGGGAKKPLTHPFGDAPPTPAIPIIAPMPQADGPPDRWTPRFATVQDLLDTSKLRKPQLFEHWSTEDIHLTSAIGGVGKTTIKLYEAICLAVGEDFLGFKCVQPGRTLFIIGEDSEAKLYAMMGKICNQLGFFEYGNEHKLQTVLNNVVIKLANDLTLVWRNPQTRMIGPNHEAINKLKEAIDDLQPRQIIFDPMAMFWGQESDGNDMAMAVAKSMQILQRISNASIDMIHHIGKDSASKKDVGQFSGRGATALANHSRVIRTLLKLNENEYSELMGEELGPDQTAIQVVVSKFSDGSPILDKPFIVLRNGYLFERREIPVGQAGATTNDCNRILQFIRLNSNVDKPLTEKNICDHFFIQDPKITRSTCKASIGVLQTQGAIVIEDHPNVTVGKWVRAV